MTATFSAGALIVPSVPSRRVGAPRYAGRVALLLATLAMLAGPAVAGAQPARDDWKQPDGLIQPIPAETLCPPSSEVTLERQPAPWSPRPGAPDGWLLTRGDAGLWSGADGAALRFTTVPSGTYLKPLGPRQSERIPVFYSGDGKTRTMGDAWVDAAATAPATTPRWLLQSDVPATSMPEGPTRVSYLPPPRVTAPHVAVIDGATGELLYGQQPDTPVPPASTTKVMTTLLAIERAGPAGLARVITSSVSGSQMAARDGSSVMGLEPGERISLGTLLYGMMLLSGNDAAEQVALSLGGPDNQFITWMNEKAQELGLKNTRFRNASGMDAVGHCISAYDLAQIGRHAMRNAAFRNIVATTWLFQEDYGLRNINPLLSAYEGADGIKTGFTDGAGRTILASATRGGHRVIVAVMHSQNPAGDSAALLDWAWQAFRWG